MKKLCALLLLAAAARAQSQAVVQQRLEMVTRTLAGRRAALESLFRQVGCAAPDLTAQSVPRSPEPNLVCALDPENPSAIVVGGHYDFVDRGTGAVDDWSGVALLPSLYQNLKAAPRRHSFLFVAFAGEEQGLWGSTQYVRKLTREQRAATRAMINLECLGLAPPKVWGSRANPKLFDAFLRTASATRIRTEVVNVDQLGDDDSHPFLNAGIPVLTIHSVTPQNFEVLHSPADNLKAIHPQDYYDTYRLTAAYLAYLDTKLN